LLGVKLIFIDGLIIFRLKVIYYTRVKIAGSLVTRDWF
jgi:hypothetical protein